MISFPADDRPCGRPTQAPPSCAIDGLDRCRRWLPQPSASPRRHCSDQRSWPESHACIGPQIRTAQSCRRPCPLPNPAGNCAIEITEAIAAILAAALVGCGLIIGGIALGHAAQRGQDRSPSAASGRDGFPPHPQTGLRPLGPARQRPCRAAIAVKAINCFFMLEPPAPMRLRVALSSAAPVRAGPQPGREHCVTPHADLAQANRISDLWLEIVEIATEFRQLRGFPPNPPGSARLCPTVEQSAQLAGSCRGKRGHTDGQGYLVQLCRSARWRRMPRTCCGAPPSAPHCTAGTSAR